MKKEFVTYEIALSLKELGFSEPCLGFFDKELFLFCLVDQKSDCEINTITYKNGLNNIIADINYETIIIVPLWQQVIDWFREKHKIRVCNLVNIYIEATFIIYHSTDVEVIDGNDFYKTREQAILKAIELCKKQ